jgi:hypothetical protein
MSMSTLAIAIADIHGELEVLEKILEEHSNAHYILIAGDLTNFGREKEAEKVLAALEHRFPQSHLYFVAGNCDTVSARNVFSQHPGYIEGKCARILEDRDRASNADNPLWVIGCGGGLVHTGLTPFERKDEDLASSLQAAFLQCNFPNQSDKQKADEPKPLIVLTHTPPNGTYADMRHMRHVGSSSFISFLYEYKPLLWICGHIHEGRSIQAEDRTLIINPGPAAHGSYALIAFERQGSSYHAVAELKGI